MKILFVYPNRNAQVGFHYGLASLSALLQRDGHRVRLLNLNEKVAPVPPDGELLETIRKEAPDLVGFSVVTPQYKYALGLGGAVRERLRIPVILGGPHATMVPENLLRDGGTDFVCVGEGETSFLPFVNGRGFARPLEDHEFPGIARLREGSLVLPPLPPLPDLAALPPLDYGLFDFQEMIRAKDGWVGLMASRGCPFRCSYCINHHLVRLYRDTLEIQPYIRYRPLSQVLAEIRDLLARYRGITTFIFDDDLFTFHREYLQEFCRDYPGISRLPFVVNAHVLRCGPEDARALKAAGCCLVKFGLESGSPRVRREVLQRNMGNDQIVSALARCREAGLPSSTFVMFGLPTETAAEMEETVDLLAVSRPDRVRWTYFFPFPMTDAGEMARREGLIDEERLARMDNFMDETPLTFGDGRDRWLRKVRKALPWLVNARIPGETGARFAEKAREIREMGAAEWERREPGFDREERELSGQLDRDRVPHYRVRYQNFMMVWEGEDDDRSHPPVAG